jgi:hypothetical protein
MSQHPELTPAPPVALVRSGKHTGQPASESPYWEGRQAKLDGRPRAPNTSYMPRGQQTWLYGYDNPTAYDGPPPYAPKPKGHMRLTTGGPLGFDIPREHHVVASAVSPDFNSGVALIAFTGPKVPGWPAPYMVYELDYHRAMPRNSGDYQSRSEAYGVFAELAMALGAGQPEEGVRG